MKGLLDITARAPKAPAPRKSAPVVKAALKPKAPDGTTNQTHANRMSERMTSTQFEKLGHE